MSSRSKEPKMLLRCLLQSRQIFSSLRKFALFHAFSDVVVDEGALGVHEVKLVVDARKDFGDGRAVRDPQQTQCVNSSCAEG